MHCWPPSPAIQNEPGPAGCGFWKIGEVLGNVGAGGTGGPLACDAGGDADGGDPPLEPGLLEETLTDAPIAALPGLSCCEMGSIRMPSANATPGAASSAKTKIGTPTALTAPPPAATRESAASLRPDAVRVGRAH